MKSPKLVHVLSKNLGSEFGSNGKFAGGNAVLLYSLNFINSMFKISGCLVMKTKNLLIKSALQDVHFINNIYISAKLYCSHGSFSILNKQGFSNGRQIGSIVLFEIQLTKASSRNLRACCGVGSAFKRFNALPAKLKKTAFTLYADGDLIPAGPYLE